MDWIIHTINFLYTNLQVENFQRCMSSLISQFTCLTYIVTYMHPLQVAVLLYTVLDRVQCLYFKPRMSGSKHESISDVTGTVLYFSRYCAVKFKMFS